MKIKNSERDTKIFIEDLLDYLTNIITVGPPTFHPWQVIEETYQKIKKFQCEEFGG